MTITRISPGVWELRTRHGTLIATGDLHTVVNVWAKLRRDGWSDVAHGHPRADRGPTDSRMRHDARPSMPRVHRPRTGRGLAACRNTSVVSMTPRATPPASQLSARSRPE